MQKMQTVVANELGIPRGKKGSQAVRMEAVEYSEKKLRERLIKVSQSVKRWTERLLEKKRNGRLRYPQALGGSAVYSRA